MNCRSNWKRYLSRLLSGLTAITLAFLGTSPFVQAQLQPWVGSNDVFVDLSVLADNGAVQSPNSPARVYLFPDLRGQITDPPRQMPVSRFIGRVQTKIATKQTNFRKVILIPPGRHQKIRRKVSKRTLVASKQQKLMIKPRVAAKQFVAKSATKSSPSKTESPAGKPRTRPSKTTPQITMTQPSAKANKIPPPPDIPSAPPPKPKVAELKSKLEKAAPAPEVPLKPRPQEKQQASLPTTNDPAKLVNVMFAPGGSELNSTARKSLDKIATKLNSNENIRMQLIAYAGERKMTASKARRLSLSRALAVRTYLISKGIRGTRIDVRALGNKLPSGLPNRVDLRVVGR